MQFKIYPDYQQLSKATADLIIEYIQNKKKSLVCIASGHTPVGVFKCLVDAVRAGHLDLIESTFLSLDEWLGIDPSDSGSCLSMLKRDFFDHLSLATDQIEFFNVHAADLNKECERINDLISAHGGLDIMLVGVGTNGHIGMNEPGTSFDSYAHIGELAEETKAVGQKYFEKATVLSKGATLGLRHFREAVLPILMANGEKKAEIVYRALTITPQEEVPASIIQLIPQGYVMVDKEAGAKF